LTPASPRENGPSPFWVRRCLADIRDAEDRGHALRAVPAFAHDFGAKWPKAVAKVVDDTDELLASSTSRRALDPPQNLQRHRVPFSATFEKGLFVERPNDPNQEAAA
jgi:hypothetical protein